MRDYLIMWICVNEKKVVLWATGFALVTIYKKQPNTGQQQMFRMHKDLQQDLCPFRWPAFEFPLNPVQLVLHLHVLPVLFVEGISDLRDLSACPCHVRFIILR